MDAEFTARCVEAAEHFAALCGIDCYVLDAERRAFVNPPSVPKRFCEEITYEKCCPLNTHLYGASEAARWSGKYIYYCAVGFVFAAAALTGADGAALGSLIAGPVIMGEAGDTLDELPRGDMRAAAQGLPVLSTARVSHLSELLALVADSVSEGTLRARAGHVYEQEKILKEIYAVKDKYALADASVYPIAYEKRLHELIVARDKAGSQELLNELLGHIYCSCDFDLSEIRARILELFVLISRASIDAGANVGEIFGFSTAYIRDIEHAGSLDELGVCITDVLHRFISYTFDFAQVKHSDTVYKVMEYVRSNYMKKLSLDEIASSVYLSRSYLSSLFKEETGTSLTSYISRVRVEKSKILLADASLGLADIADMCGFEDQSYFTKVFKKYVGVSPNRFRTGRN